MRAKRGAERGPSGPEGTQMRETALHKLLSTLLLVEVDQNRPEQIRCETAD
jgi:hypothetical protein